MRQNNGLTPVLRRWGHEAGTAGGSESSYRLLTPDEVKYLAHILAGQNGLALGDLPPREGLTWLIQWGGRPWPSSCGGASTDLLLGYKGKSYFVFNGKIPEIPSKYGDSKGGEGTGGPDHLNGLLEMMIKPSFAAPGHFKDSVLFIPFTNITLEYLNLLFIYAGRGYPFRMVDSSRDYCPLPALNPPGDVPSGDFSVFDLEARVLTLLVVEQSFAMVNLSKAAAHRDIIWNAFEIGSQEELLVTFQHALNSSGDVPVFTVPFYSSMSEAVDAFLDYKWSSRGGGASLPYREPEKVLAEMPFPSKQKIQRVKDFCNALYENHGRFPVHLQPFHLHLIMLAWGRG